MNNIKSIIILSKCNTLRVIDGLNAQKVGNEPKVLHLEFMHKFSDYICDNILVILGYKNVIGIHKKVYFNISHVIHMKNQIRFALLKANILHKINKCCKPLSRGLFEAVDHLV